MGRLAEGPRLADPFDVERRYARVTQAWLDLRQRSLEYQAVVMEAWPRAGKLFSEELAGRTSADGRAPDSKSQLQMWTQTANRVLLEAQRSERFLQTQAAQIRASTDLRLAQRDLVEYYGERFGLPTRTELDDVHRTLTELRREVRVAAAGASRRGGDPPGCARERFAGYPTGNRGQVMAHNTTPADAVSGAAQAVSDAAEVGKKMLAGTRPLNRLSDKDVEIATTPKDLVWTRDKVSLYHYRPLAERAVETPVLITYGMVGRWTMTDLQDDRSLVQNLLRLGVDLYVVDWGNPSRADRYLTLDDDICGYLDDRVSEICRRAGVDEAVSAQTETASAASVPPAPQADPARPETPRKAGAAKAGRGKRGTASV